MLMFSGEKKKALKQTLLLGFEGARSSRISYQHILSTQ